jgi:hypothetical protein
LASNRLFWLSVTALENCTRGAYTNDVVIRSHGLYNIVVDPVGVSTESSLEVLAVLLRSNGNSMRMLMVGGYESVSILVQLSTFAFVEGFKGCELTLPFLLKSGASSHIGSLFIVARVFVNLQSLLAVLSKHLVHVKVLLVAQKLRVR